MSIDGTIGGVRDQSVVAVVRHGDRAVAEAIARACVDGGVRAVEITLTTPGAVELVAALADLPDVLLGAGTVRTPEDVRAVAAAGATFVVSPVTDRAVVAAALDVGVEVVPGAFSPTEVAEAAAIGATMVKVFPAGVLGTSFVRGVATVLPEVPLLVSGGIGLDDVRSWRAAGAHAVAIGSDLVAAHDAGGPDAVRAVAARLASIPTPDHDQRATTTP